MPEEIDPAVANDLVIHAMVACRRCEVTSCYARSASVLQLMHESIVPRNRADGRGGHVAV